MPERLQYPGRDVAAVVSNLFWSLHQYDVRKVTAEEMLDNTGFFKNDEIKKIYLSIDFYSNTINLRNRINIYSQRIKEVNEERNKISSSIRIYLKELNSK